MPAAPYDLEVEQFTPLLKTFFYRDIENQPVDLTGWSAHMQIRSTTGELLADASTEGGSIVLGADGGIRINIDTDKVKGRGLYDMLVTPPGQQPYRLMAGEVHFSKGQTRP